MVVVASAAAFDDAIKAIDLTGSLSVPGTRIATPDGDITVELVRPGRTVLPHFTAAAPVPWVGHRTLDPRRHPRPQDALPNRGFGACLRSRHRAGSYWRDQWMIRHDTGCAAGG